MEPDPTMMRIEIRKNGVRFIAPCGGSYYKNLTNFAAVIGSALQKKNNGGGMTMTAAPPTPEM